MEKKKKGRIFTIVLIVIAVISAPKVYNFVNERIAQKVLVKDATASIQALCQEYGIDEYKMEVVFLNDFIYYINLTASDSDISESQIREFSKEIWSYSFKDPKHYWSRSTSGVVEVNEVSYHIGGLTSREWFEKERSRNQVVDSTSTSSARHTDSEAWSCAMSIVKDSLKSPSTAKFCPFTECRVTHLGNGEYKVTGWVDAQNSYGATLRSNFVVTYTATERGYKNGVAVIE